jgi:cell division septation protein DedD
MSRSTSQPKQSKKKTSAKRSQFAVELTRKEVFLWLGVAFFAMVWMFTLGVIVGRGLSPVRFDVAKLTKELTALKEVALKAKEETDKPSFDKLSHERHLGFYDILTDKKEAARLKSLPKAPKAVSMSPAQDEPPRRAELKTRPTVTPDKKQEQETTSSLAKKEPTDRSFTLQVAALKDSTRAEAMVSNLKRKGYGAYAITANITGKGTYYRVRVGHFKDRHDAKQVATMLRHEKLEPIVIRE